VKRLNTNDLEFEHEREILNPISVDAAEYLSLLTAFPLNTVPYFKAPKGPRSTLSEVNLALDFARRDSM
jgi:hypothetical protein